MPLQKILLKPGVNRENTRYTNEGGWYECDKVRFRQGTPEVIGGWQPYSSATYQGICRSLWNWVLLNNLIIISVGTNLKFYIETGTVYYDITPLRATSTINNNPFVATNGSRVITVTDTSHGASTGDFVTFSGATGLGGTVNAAVLNAEHQITTVLTANTYTITVTTAANTTDATNSPGGGASVVAAYQISVGPITQQPLVGWGAGGWGLGTWDNSVGATIPLRLWSQQNFGEDLVFNPRGGGIYYWDATGGLSARGVLLNTLGGTVTFTNSVPTGIAAATTYYAYNVEGLTFGLTDSTGAEVSTSSTGTGVYVSLIVDVPTIANSIVVSDTSRFIITFGANDYGSAILDPMLIRWSSQEDPYNWTPTATNQAGSVRLSHGSEILATVQARQEIVVFTDSSVYSLQYLGQPYVWAPQLLGDNISIMGPNAAIIASGIVYWMGVDKFYAYDGRVQTLNCDLRRYVFSDLNQLQRLQIFCGTNEGFNEVWWFYCSGSSTTVDRYVIYNYLEKVWYYGTMERTAWLDSGIEPYPISAKYNSTAVTGNLINQEIGLNDNTTGVNVAIDAYISSAEFDINDGHNFGFVWRILPDLTFGESTNSPSGALPQTTMTLYGLANSGSGSTGNASGAITEGTTYVITEEFTGQINTRVRGRQMILKMASNQINTAWQLGAPRMDIRPDGRR